MNGLLKFILKHVAAAALGGALSAGAAAKIDPDHFGKSVKDLGKIAGAGAIGAVTALHVRAPKDEADPE